jgi:hypothetical protein
MLSLLSNLRKMLLVVKLNALTGRNSKLSLEKTIKVLIRVYRRNGKFTDEEKEMYNGALNEIKNVNNDVLNSNFETFEYNGEVENGK